MSSRKKKQQQRMAPSSVRDFSHATVTVELDLNEFIALVNLATLAAAGLLGHEGPDVDHMMGQAAMALRRLLPDKWNALTSRLGVLGAAAIEAHGITGVRPVVRDLESKDDRTGVQ